MASAIYITLHVSLDGRSDRQVPSATSLVVLDHEIHGTNNCMLAEAFCQEGKEWLRPCLWPHTVLESNEYAMSAHINVDI